MTHFSWNWSADWVPKGVVFATKYCGQCKYKHNLFSLLGTEIQILNTAKQCGWVRLKMVITFSHPLYLFGKDQIWWTEEQPLSLNWKVSIWIPHGISNLLAHIENINSWLLWILLNLQLLNEYQLVWCVSLPGVPSLCALVTELESPPQVLIHICDRCQSVLLSTPQEFSFLLIFCHNCFSVSTNAS